MSWIHIPPWLKPFELKPVELTYAPRVIESFETLSVRLAYHRTWERLPEGLELLAMTAVADFDAELRGVKRHDRPFYQVMYHKRNRRRGSVCEFDAAKLQQPFRLVVCIQEHLLDTQHHEQLFRIISRIFSPAVRSERSEEYQIARRTAFKSIRKAGLRRLCKQLTIPVVATVNFSQGFDRIAPLYDLLGDIYEQQQHEASRVLVLEGIKLMLARPAVPILSIDAVDVDPIGRIMQEWLCGAARSMRLNLHASTRHLNGHEIVAMFSRVATGVDFGAFSHSMYTPSENGEPDPENARCRRLWIQWMAFAFFIPFSRSTVRKLCFSLWPDDVRAIQEVLLARNPFQVLLGASERAFSLLQS